MLFMRLFYAILWENNINTAITNLCSLRLYYVCISKKIMSMLRLPTYILSTYVLCTFQEDAINATITNIVLVTKAINSFLP
jgi:hypothetical protein